MKRLILAASLALISISAMAQERNPATLEQQITCAEYGERFIARWKANKENVPPNSRVIHLTHYNTKMNRCLVEVRVTEVSSSGIRNDSLEEVVDAVEGKAFAWLKGGGLCWLEGNFGPEDCDRALQYDPSSKYRVRVNSLMTE